RSGDAGGAVGVDADERGGGDLGRALAPRVEVEAEVADVGVPGRAHHHVVGEPGRPGAEIAVELERVAPPTQHPVVEHRHHQEVPVGQPAESRGLPGVLDLTPAVPLLVDREDAPGVEVGEPQASLVPAGGLTEVDAVDEALRDVGFEIGHLAPPGRPWAGTGRSSPQLVAGASGRAPPPAGGSARYRAPWPTGGCRSFCTRSFACSGACASSGATT